MKYVDCLDDWSDIVSSVNGKKIVILPTFVHEIHYIRNKPSLLYGRILDHDDFEFVVGLGHPDLFNLPIEKLNEIKPKEIWTINQKQLLSILKNNNINDISMFYYLLKNNVPEWILDVPVHIYYQRKFGSIFNNLNNIIPATKHIEIHQINAEKISDILKNFNKPEAFSSYRAFGYTIFKLESVGIKVNPSILKKFYSNKIIPHISSDNYVYSEYNFYTSTGRPSNRFGSINFAAIDKKSGVRKAFIPRYDYFILFDFDSYHLNLIAKFIGYKFNTNIHEYLGQYYFGKKQLTQEEYEKSKVLNFRYLYGGIPKEIRDTIPYFEQVQKFTYDMWYSMKKYGYYESPLTKRKLMLEHIKNPNPMKVLNYFIQLVETETAMIIIDRLQKYLENFETKLILYTYDSFLFDYSKKDGKECIIGIKKILDIFPTKVYFGKNYQDLIDVTNKLLTKMK